MEKKQLIYAVDDEYPIRELYSCTLENAQFVPVCLASADELFKALNEKIPDLILLDVMLEGISGFDILRHLKAEAAYQDIPVIMVSAKGKEMSKVKGLNLGADDYISKPFGVLELTARINAALRKNKRSDVIEALRYRDIVINEETHSCSINHQDVYLTLKEYRLLKILIEDAQKVLNKTIIFAKVWEVDFIGETRTLDIHLTSLRKKLKAADSVVEIKTIRGVGYVIE